MNIQQTSQAQELRQELLKQETQDPRASQILVARSIMWELLEKYPLAMGCREEISEHLDWEQCTGFFQPIPALHLYIIDPTVAQAWKAYSGDEYGCGFCLPVEWEAHVADEALLLTYGPRHLLTQVDRGGSLLGEPPNILSAVWVHTIPGQAKTTLATALELICSKQMQDKFEGLAYKGISVFCSVTAAGFSKFHPIPLDADYLVLPMVPAAREAELCIAHENACSDSDRLLVRRLLSMEYLTEGVPRNFTLLPPCHSLIPTDKPSARELTRQPNLWYNILYAYTTPQGYCQPVMNCVATSQDEIVAGGVLYTYTSLTVPAPWPSEQPPNLGAGTDAVEAKKPSPLAPAKSESRSSRTRKTRVDSDGEAEEGGDMNDEICRLAMDAATNSQRQDEDFAPGVETNPCNPGSSTGAGVLACTGANTNLSVIPGDGVEMQFFGSRGASHSELHRSEPNIGPHIDEIIKEQACYTEALEKDMEAVAQQIIHSGAKAMRETGGRTDEFIQSLNTLATKLFAEAWEIQMSMDGSTNVDIGTQLNRLEERTEEMVTTATILAAQYEAGSKTFDATLRKAEAKIKEQTDAKLEESIQRYMEAVKQHVISVHKHTDAGPFILHLMEAVAFHRMNMRMVHQCFCAESTGMLLALVLSQCKNAFTITGFLKFYACCLTRDVRADQECQIETQQCRSEVTLVNRLESQLEEQQRVIDKQDDIVRELMERKEPRTMATTSPRPGVGTWSI